MFVAILLSQFSPCPGMTIATDDIITATDDVMTGTDDVMHIIWIVLEGKLMCWNRVAYFMATNSLVQIYFLELHMEILMQQLLHSSKKICSWWKFLYTKKYFIKNRFLDTILRNDRPWRACFDYKAIQDYSLLLGGATSY